MGPASGRVSLPTARRRGRPRPAHDPFRPLDVLVEEERCGDGGVARWLTIFLTGAECPFGCVFCDLWRHTLHGPTPSGALPAQVATALQRPQADGVTGVKLYNASNLFEPRALPPADDAALAELLGGFRRVLVECHPNLVGERCFAFARRLADRGARLEVAMGLETVHPEALPRLGKGMSLERFDRACGELRVAGCGVRAFVLVGAPFVPAEEAARWAVRSAAHAFDRGAEHVTLIPVRGGTPEMEELRVAGAWTPPSLGTLEDALDATLDAVPDGSVATADLWDLERFLDCAACATARRRRLQRLNRTGRREARVVCRRCEG